MSKDSIRKKIEAAKKEAEDLLKSKKVAKETATVIGPLLLVIDIIVSVLLEKKTRKNSSNIGLPPSRNNGSNGNRNTVQGDREKKGEQLQNTRNVETEEITSPNECGKCNENKEFTWL